MLKISLNNSTISNATVSNTITNKLTSIDSLINELVITNSDVILAGTFNTSITLEDTSLVHLDSTIHLNNSFLTLKNTTKNFKTISISGQILKNEFLKININPNIYLKINVAAPNNTQIDLFCLNNSDLLPTKIENLSQTKINLLPQTNSDITILGFFNNINFSDSTNISLSLPPSATVSNYQNIHSSTFNKLSGTQDNLNYLSSNTTENIQDYITSIIYTLNVIKNKALLTIPKSSSSTLIDKAYILLNNKSFLISIEN
ncbi:MAG: hypothetical protein ACRDDL_06355 [Sarcina sp.]